MKYRHEIAEAELEALTVAATDAQIADKLARYLLAGQSIGPFHLALNHNAKAAPCPVHIDRPGVKRSTVTLATFERALAWVIDALSRGYEVQFNTRKGVETVSIARTKRRMQSKLAMDEWRAKLKRGEAVDDDIPF